MLTGVCRDAPAKIGNNNSGAFQAIVLDEMNNCLPTIAPNHMILFKIIKDHEGPYQQEAYNGPSKAIGDHMGPYRSRQDNRRPYWTIHMTIQDILARL